MASVYYSNTAVATTLSGNISAGGTSMAVGAVTGFPTSYPYILAVDYDASGEELVKVTAASSTTLTVERGFGGTSAASHSLGAVVRHVINAQDLTDFRTHEEDGTAVHGLTGSVVGTSDTQTLSNKTLTAPVVSAPVISGGGQLDGSFTGEPVFTAGFTMGTVAVNESAGGNFQIAEAGFLAERALATEEAFASLATGDTFDRFRVTADGAMAWGPGTAARDVVLYRSGADVLRTDDILLFDRPATTSDVVRSRVAGDAGYRFALEANGVMGWGDGTGTTLDTGLSRTAAGALTADATFSADVETSTSFTVASGFSLTAARHRRTCGVVQINVLVSVTSDITGTGFAGNITDKSLGTLPPGYRPFNDFVDGVEAVWSNGIVSGSAVISWDGVITLRTSDTDGTIQSGTNLRLTATFIP